MLQVMLTMFILTYKLDHDAVQKGDQFPPNLKSKGSVRT